MKKITLLLMMLCLTLSTTSLIAQTDFSVSMNGGTTYASSPGSFAGYTWNGVGNHAFNNTNYTGISLSITGYDETVSGPELYIRFSRVGFGNAPLGWGSDNVTSLATLVPADFIGGAATVTVDIPVGTLPVAQTADYVSGYLWILQIVDPTISFWTILLYVSLVYLSKTLVPSFNFLSDLGVREFSSIFFLGLCGVAPEVALSAGMFIWVVNLLLPSLLGGILIWRK